MSNDTCVQHSEMLNDTVVQDVTPESEVSMDGFTNYTASEAFIQGLAGLVNQSDVETMIRAQKQMYVQDTYTDQ